MPASMATPTPCACIRVRRAARTLSDLYDEALRPCGLKITQLSLLRTVARMQAPTLSGLAEAMALDRSTLGRNAGLLKRRGLVQISDGSDLRERAVTVTPRGRRLLEQAAPLWEQAQQRVHQSLGQQGLDALFHLLAKVEGLR